MHHRNMFFGALASIFCFGAVFAAAAADEWTPEAKGTSIVKAALKKLHDSKIFPDDHDLMRRIGWVESKDGNDAGTYRANYHGGIWQVDNIGFVDTQTHPTAKKKLHAKIKEKYGLDWTKVTWQELRKPALSALAARAKLYITGRPSSCLQAIPTGLQEQAQYWKNCYNSAAGAGTVAKFLADVARMPS
ncbi:uncharacterized protein LOC129583914 [Paramacrobiotus metropolitanus]|uniref:uncharacterized protein LOC129583914 n=1 Tax=Paramacrobiotus metropolitanus TaxID=2943436 RepID=UPI0024459867|nr:uncharacterized protein LOC129583914 [Paramacrobiotus metropolitanus]